MGQTYLEKIILGTVQLGMRYGINNSTGQPSNEEARTILNYAFENGIRTLDTAEAYGNSQNIIGSFHKEFPVKKFKVLTKFKASGLSLIEQLKKSCEELYVAEVDCYSFHSYADLFNDGLIDQLVTLKKNNLIKNIGVSVYTNDEFKSAISVTEIDSIQIPFNLFDNWNKRGDLISLAKKMGKKIHVRSVYLQGVLHKDLNSYPDYLQDLKPYMKKVIELSNQFKVNISALAFMYALECESIDGVLIGVEKLSQLKENLQFLRLNLPPELIKEVNLIDAPSELLDPRNWK